jgi:hypothetical protein
MTVDELDELSREMVMVWSGGWSDYEECHMATIWETMEGDLWVHETWANPMDSPSHGDEIRQITWDDVLEIMESYGETRELGVS